MGGGSSTEGSGGANQGQLKKYKPPSKAESDAIQTRSLYKKTKRFVNKPGITKSKGSGASTGCLIYTSPSPRDRG